MLQYKRIISPFCLKVSISRGYNTYPPCLLRRGNIFFDSANKKKASKILLLTSNDNGIKLVSNKKDQALFAECYTQNLIMLLIINEAFRAPCYSN